MQCPLKGHTTTHHHVIYVSDICMPFFNRWSAFLKRLIVTIFFNTVSMCYTSFTSMSLMHQFTKHAMIMAIRISASELTTQWGLYYTATKAVLYLSFKRSTSVGQMMSYFDTGMRINVSMLAMVSPQGYLVGVVWCHSPAGWQYPP